VHDGRPKQFGQPSQLPALRLEHLRVAGGLLVGLVGALIPRIGVFLVGSALGVVVALVLNTTVLYRLYPANPTVTLSVAAVVLGFAFFFVNQAASAFGSAEVIPPWLAAWLPPLLTALAAFTLLFYTEDG
jgi:hypothetical protein